jgi:hypothetical protein
MTLPHALFPTALLLGLTACADDATSTTDTNTSTDTTWGTRILASPACRFVVFGVHRRQVDGNGGEPFKIINALETARR